MDSTPTFSYTVSPRPASVPHWIFDIWSIDVLKRNIRLSSYVDTSEYDGVTLPLPDRTHAARAGSMAHLKPLNHNAILEITRGANTGTSARATRVASLYRALFAPITACLYDFGVTKELYAGILKEISDYLRRNPREIGGEMEVKIWRTITQTVQRHDDPHVDAYVERVLRRSLLLARRKPVPADSSAIDSLEQIRFSRECVICKDDFEDGSMVTQLPCDHLFHGDCIKTWFQINRGCPLCRKPVS
ncbi:PREDICTED: E3 ubiquitin-protein ligase SGR9, amyloplastic [Tarenaya hassleriana]|uniref:E3 ubiquitin-protein ligase SGR9, amyloplastic n=1 Tax=Tarenaya hassleriana TaxID=28532 RepID=UPI00053C62A8|nr:PREDICTED: E3 ubiquitin-protein ligase SGR9, amyloplastic [Tarenaya hassleriana]